MCSRRRTMAKAIGALRMLALQARLLRKKQIPDWRRRMQLARSGADGAAAAGDLASGAAPADGGAAARSLVITPDLCRDVLADLELVCMAGQACDDWAGAAARAAANSTARCVRLSLAWRPRADPSAFARSLSCGGGRMQRCTSGRWTRCPRRPTGAARRRCWRRCWRRARTWASSSRSSRRRRTPEPP